MFKFVCKGMNYAQPLKKGSPQPVGASCGVIMKYDQNKTIGMKEDDCLSICSKQKEASPVGMLL